MNTLTSVCPRSESTRRPFPILLRQSVLGTLLVAALVAPAFGADDPMRPYDKIRAQNNSDCQGCQPPDPLNNPNQPMNSAPGDGGDFNPRLDRDQNVIDPRPLSCADAGALLASLRTKLDALKEEYNKIQIDLNAARQKLAQDQKRVAELQLHPEPAPRGAQADSGDCGNGRPGCMGVQRVAQQANSPLALAQRAAAADSQMVGQIEAASARNIGKGKSVSAQIANTIRLKPSCHF